MSDNSDKAHLLAAELYIKNSFGGTVIQNQVHIQRSIAESLLVIARNSIKNAEEMPTELPPPTETIEYRAGL